MLLLLHLPLAALNQGQVFAKGRNSPYPLPPTHRNLPYPLPPTHRNLPHPIPPNHINSPSPLPPTHRNLPYPLPPAHIRTFSPHGYRATAASVSVNVESCFRAPVFCSKFRLQSSRAAQTGCGLTADCLTIVRMLLHNSYLLCEKMKHTALEHLEVVVMSLYAIAC